MIKNEAPTRFRAVLSCGRIKITTGVLPVFTSSTMRLSLWLILPTTLSDDGVATGSFWSRAPAVRRPDVGGQRRWRRTRGRLRVVRFPGLAPGSQAHER